MMEEPGTFCRLMPSILSFNPMKAAPKKTSIQVKPRLVKSLRKKAVFSMLQTTSDEVTLFKDKRSQGQDEERIGQAVDDRIQIDLRRDRQSMDHFSLEVEVFQIGERGVEDSGHEPARTGLDLFDQGFQSPSDVAGQI